MRRGILIVSGLALVAAAFAGALAGALAGAAEQIDPKEPAAEQFDPKDAAPWHVARISRLDSPRLDAKAPENEKDQKDKLVFLHLGLRLNPALAEPKLHKFLVVNKKGEPVGELAGFYKDRALLVFESEKPWDSLIGLYLDGLGHREPLFQVKPVPPKVPKTGAIPPDRVIVQTPPAVRVPKDRPPTVHIPSTEVRQPGVTIVPGTKVAEAPETVTVVEGGTRVVRIPQTTRVVGGGTQVIRVPGTRVVVGGGGGSGAGAGGGGPGAGGGGGGPGAGGGASQQEPEDDGIGPWDLDPLAQQIAKTLPSLSAGAGSGSGAGAGGGAGGAGASGGSGQGAGGGAGGGAPAAGAGGAGAGADSGSATGAGSGAGTTAGSGAGQGSAGSGAGSGGGLGSGAGAGSGTGSGTGNGTGQGSGSGTGQGSGAATGQGTGAGQGSGAGTGQGSGAGSGAGSGQGSGMGAGQGTGPGDAGEGPGPGEGEGPGPEEGPGPGEGEGPGPEEGPTEGMGPQESGPREDMGPREFAPRESMGPGEPQGPLPGMKAPPGEQPLPGMAPDGGGGPGGARGGPGPRTIGPNYKNIAPRFGPRFKNIAPHLFEAPDFRGPEIPYYNPEIPYYNPELAMVRPGRPGYGRGYGGGGGGGFGRGYGGGDYPERKMLPLPPLPKIPIMPKIVLYISCGDATSPGYVFQVDDGGRVLGVVKLPYAATGLALHRQHGLIAAIPRDGGKLMRIDESGKVSTILEKHKTLVHPVDVALAADSDTVVVADNVSDCLAAMTTAGTEPKIYHQFEGQKWAEQDMSVAVTRDRHVIFGTDGDAGIYRFAGDDFTASRGPLLPKRGWVAADTASLKWAATQNPDEIYVFEGEELMKKFQLPANKSHYLNGRLSFAPTGAVVAAARDSDMTDPNPWLIQYHTKEVKNEREVRILFQWDRAPMLDFVVGPRMYWERHEPSTYKSIY